MYACLYVCTVNLNLGFAETIDTDISGSFLLGALIIQHLESLTICKKPLPSYTIQDNYIRTLGFFV